MLYEVQIKLTSPMLGDTRDRTQVRRFSRNKKDILQLNPELWAWICNSAAESLEDYVNIDLETIMAPPTIWLPVVELYIRRLHTTNGTPFTEKHECISSGTELRFIMLVTAQRPGIQSDKKRVPSIKELEALFIFAGQYMGLSPFGITKGYGRFELISLKPYATNKSASG